MSNGVKRSTVNGGHCKGLEKGDKRRLADGRNAWRKMDHEQRQEFVAFLFENGLDDTLGRLEKKCDDR